MKVAAQINGKRTDTSVNNSRTIAYACEGEKIPASHHSHTHTQKKQVT